MNQELIERIKNIVWSGQDVEYVFDPETGNQYTIEDSND